MWHLSDVLVWLTGRGSYPIGAAPVEIAKAAEQANLAKEVREIEAGPRE